MYNKLHNLKHRPYGSEYINATHRNIPFRLVLVTMDTTRDTKLATLLAQWRKKVLHFIPSTKPITIRGTRQWLIKRVIEEKDRLLFLVVVGDVPIGHVGLYRYNPKENSIVIDNVIRGAAGYPGVMGESIRTLIRWAKKTFHIRSFFVDCSSNNDKAIALYKRIGFREIDREPLIRTKTEGGYIFVNAPKESTRPIKYYRVLFRYNEKNAV